MSEQLRVDATRHTGRVVLITGAASGIGRAAAIRMAGEGAAVVGCDIDAGGLAQTRAAASERVQVEVADITDGGDVERLVATVVEVHGRIDVLANVAGVLDNFKGAHETDDATWRRVMGVNVDGPMHLSRAVLPHLREQGGGAIVNVGSQASLRGGTAGYAYTTSKHALLGQTRSIAWLYAADGVRCNAVCPGGVETNISTSLTDPSQLGLERTGPVLGTMPPIASADQIAALVSWLASDEATNVNGAVITSDGGWAVG